jgi:hypothetical protein
LEQTAQVVILGRHRHKLGDRLSVLGDDHGFALACPSSTTARHFVLNFPAGMLFITGPPKRAFLKSSIPWLLCGDTTILRLTAVKLEGRQQITAAELAHGARLTSGDSFK